jgi:conjugal transfer pilus assembly protein TraE
MKLDVFVKKASNLYAENRLLKFAVVIIGMTTIINTGLLYASMSHQRTILIPSGMNVQASVTKNTADPDYLRQMARYVSGLALNYTPATARSQFEELLSLYAVDTFADNKSMLYDLADTIEKTVTGSVFHPQKFMLNDEKQWIEIFGPKTLYLQDLKSGDTELKTYLLKYRMVDGKFQIIELVEKE